MAYLDCPLDCFGSTVFSVFDLAVFRTAELVDEVFLVFGQDRLEEFLLDVCLV
jgi:hypothetical protein